LIQEFLTYIFSNCSKEARVFGHLYESISIIEREKRRRLDWLDHRNHCKELIKNEISKLKLRNKILILGSGPLHEIPMEFIIDSFENIILVDIIHPKHIVKKFSSHPKVTLVEKDITAVERLLIDKQELIQIIPDDFLDDSFDFVISANVMSQLALHITNYCSKNLAHKFTSLELENYSLIISKNHYHYLKNFSCKVLLITDIEKIYLNKKHERLESEKTIHILNFLNQSIIGFGMWP
jgi:hypothetical protein